jgi:hypothetical protein
MVAHMQATQPLVIDYLRRRSFQQLEEEHGVCARPCANGAKFSLNYDQILAKSGDPVAEQCRGLIIRPLQWNWEVFKNDWKLPTVGECEVVAWPMSRFYNYGDSAAHPIDWAHPELRVYEKVDGTCIILYWDRMQGKWHAATRSVPEADLPICVDHIEIGDTTFSQLFLRALAATREEATGQKVDWLVDGPDKVIHLNKELTYVFELVSPYNQIVVSYPEPRVYLLAARHTRTGGEIPIEELRLQHVRRPKTWPIRDVVTLSAFVDSASAAELEGAVVCVPTGTSFTRQKIKNKTYVLAHKSKDTVMSSQRNALEAVILEKVDDIVPLVPKEVGDRLLNMQRAFGDYCKEVDGRAEEFRINADGSRKRYAEQVLLSGDWTAPYFNLWENRAKSAKEWIQANCRNNKLSATSLDTILAKLRL